MGFLVSRGAVDQKRDEVAGTMNRGTRHFGSISFSAQTSRVRNRMLVVRFSPPV